MIIVYPHDMNNIGPRFDETRKFVNELKKEYQVLDFMTMGAHGYHDGLKKVWGKDDILVIEHDIVPTQEQFEEIINCPEKNCSCTFNIVIDGEDMNACRNSISDTHYDNMVSIKEDDKFCDGVGLAFTKISKDVQEKTKDEFMKNKWYWMVLDRYIMKTIFEKVGRKSWHVHRMNIKHLHEYKRQEFNAEDFVFKQQLSPEISIYEHKTTKRGYCHCIHKKFYNHICINCTEYLSKKYGMGLV